MLNEINLSKFLARYCNLKGKALSKVHHDDVSVLFPFLKRATFDEIRENPLLVITGNILLVNDGIKVVPYYVPITTKDDLEESMEFNMQEEDTGIKVDYSNHDYANMSIYELRCLLRRKYNSYRNQKNARIELENRGIVLKKKYNRSLEKRKMEEMKNERY